MHLPWRHALGFARPGCWIPVGDDETDFRLAGHLHAKKPELTTPEQEAPGHADDDRPDPSLLP